MATKNPENILELFDEDLNSYSFEVMDIIEYNGENYGVLFPLTKGIDEYVIIKYICATDEENEIDEFEAIDSVDIINHIFEEYKKRNKHLFNKKQR